jgi:hypothetical protein
MKYKLAIFFISVSLWMGTAYAATTSVKNVIVNPGDANSLSNTTGLPPAEAQNIIDQAAGNQVRPEISIPADGAKISGSGVVIKGIATPNASIDILIQAVSSVGGPILGKAVSDRYGVWSYTLAPTLSNGAYTVQVTAQVGSITPMQSDPVHFSVSGTSSGGGIGSTLETALGSGNSSSLIIILAIIVSITFIIIVIVLVMAPYARNQRAGYIDKMKSWETPELLNLNDTQWNNFVDKMESMRQYIATTGKGSGRDSPRRHEKLA